MRVADISKPVNDDKYSTKKFMAIKSVKVNTVMVIIPTIAPNAMKKFPKRP